MMITFDAANSWDYFRNKAILHSIVYNFIDDIKCYLPYFPIRLFSSDKQIYYINTYRREIGVSH